MREHDIVASALGPFHRFEPALVRAALDAGVDYTSICDEWQAAEAVIDEFDSEARERGRIIVTGLGASPGISSVGVRLLADELDRVDRADIYTYQPLDAGGGEAVLQHLLYIMSGEVAVHRNGQRMLVPACAESREEEFPRFGRVRMWNMGHSEPATIPRYLPGIREVNFYLGFGPGSELFVRPAQWGLFTTRRRVDVAARFLHKVAEFTRDETPGTGALRIDVWGERDHETVHRSVCGVGQMREATGLSLSIGTLMLGRKQLLTTSGGVYAPEGVIEPYGFVDAFREKGLELYEDLEMTRPISGAQRLRRQSRTTTAAPPVA